MSTSSAAHGPIRLLLIDDHAVMRAGLANLLHAAGGFAVVAQADDGAEAIPLWRHHRPDVGLLDLTMHGMDGVETLARLRAIDPTAKVLMLTSSDSSEDVDRALAAGANGYVTKSVDDAELFAAIREVHAGGTPVSRDRIIDVHPVPAVTNGLTPREVEVLGLMREGFSNVDIGRLLGISPNTAKVHVGGVMAKLGAVDRTQAVVKAFELGLLSVNEKTSPARHTTK